MRSRMLDLIATIFHLTDMHLYVDPSGALREEKPSDDGAAIQRDSEQRACAEGTSALFRSDVAR